MVKERPALSRAETEVARIVWELGQATVRDVHEALSRARQWEFSTVQTYLRRLEIKGYLVGRLDGRTRVYRAKVRPRTVIRESVDDLIDRLFGGEALPLMRHLIEERGINDAELAELRKLMQRLDENAS